MLLVAFTVLTAITHDLGWTLFRNNARRVAIHIAASAVLSFFAIYWTLRESYFLPVLPFLCSLAWWRCLSSFLAASWPRLFSFVPLWIVKGGPLGHGLSKFCEILVGFLLWYHTGPQAGLGSFPMFLRLGFSPSWVAILSVTLFSLTVNFVLQLWSKLPQSRGNHSGVNRMVRGSLGRALTRREHLQLLSLAAINAICEELSARVLWRSIFAVACIPTFYGQNHLNWLETIQSISTNTILTDPSITLYSNLGQATLFGIRHYYGIPSGMTGVALTFLYGFLLGWMADQTGGSIWLPIFTHTIADYYIFSVLVRRKLD
jgi:hypothetical protein